MKHGSLDESMGLCTLLCTAAVKFCVGKTKPKKRKTEGGLDVHHKGHPRPGGSLSPSTSSAPVLHQCPKARGRKVCGQERKRPVSCEEKYLHCSNFSCYIRWYCLVELLQEVVRIPLFAQKWSQQEAGIDTPIDNISTFLLLHRI